jgi:hypothetical protein
MVASWFAVASPTSHQQPRRQQRRKRMSDKPSHKVFVVENRGAEGEEQRGFWTRCGSAWPHADGRGLTLEIVPGLAVSGRVVLREWTDEEADSNKPAKRK